jgi:hypothetical protein
LNFSTHSRRTIFVLNVDKKNVLWLIAVTKRNFRLWYSVADPQGYISVQNGTPHTE